MPSLPTYRFSRTKIGQWTIEPSTSENRWVLKLEKAEGDVRKVNELSSPEAAAGVVGRVETDDFAPESHWRSKEDFELHNWVMCLQPDKPPVTDTPRKPSAIERVIAALKRQGRRAELRQA